MYFSSSQRGSCYPYRVANWLFLLSCGQVPLNLQNPTASLHRRSLTELFIDCLYRVPSPYNSSFPLLVPFPKGHVLHSITFYSNSNTSLLLYVYEPSSPPAFIPAPRNCKADEAARLFFRHVVKYWGLPKHIVSDRDPRFTGKFWRELFRSQLYTSPPLFIPRRRE